MQEETLQTFAMIFLERHQCFLCFMLNAVMQLASVHVQEPTMDSQPPCHPDFMAVKQQKS